MNALTSVSDVPVVDLRSDTVTKPTEAMYERMRTAELGDDSLDGDPTARELEANAAQILGKQAGLFVASCTMANMLAVLAQARRGDQVITDEQSHLFTAERGSATFTGTFLASGPSTRGALDLNWLEDTLSGRRSYLTTGLVAHETTHTNAGGVALPLEYLATARKLTVRQGVPVHLDGARLLNAAVALDIAPTEITQYADTVSLCLSKGLSAPIGAVLVGSEDVIAEARSYRKMLGGQLRQAGIAAAAGLEAITTMCKHLHEDHARAARLGDLLNDIHPAIRSSVPQTNILMVSVGAFNGSAHEWERRLASAGILVRAWSADILRLVTHRHITDDDIDLVAAAFETLASKHIAY